MSRPWDQQEGETDLAFKAFTLYLNMDGRSLAKAARKRADEQGRSRADVGQLERWSAANRWVQRASAYDAHVLTEAQTQLEADHIARKKALLKRDGEMADALHERVVKMLKRPLEVTEVVKEIEREDGVVEQHITIMPAGWNVNTIRLLAETASALGRRSLELPEETQRLEVTGKDGQPLGSDDPQAVLDKMTTNDLAAEYQKRVRNKPSN